jgi:hypothetical protein
MMRPRGPVPVLCGGDGGERRGWGGLGRAPTKAMAPVGCSANVGLRLHPMEPLVRGPVQRGHGLFLPETALRARGGGDLPS